MTQAALAAPVMWSAKAVPELLTLSTPPQLLAAENWKAAATLKQPRERTRQSSFLLVLSWATTLGFCVAGRHGVVDRVSCKCKSWQVGMHMVPKAPPSH